MCDGANYSAQGFLTFMSGYTVFLGPFAGIMVTDYWLLHRCKVDVPAMYDPHGRYRYAYGFVGTPARCPQSDAEWILCRTGAQF